MSSRTFHSVFDFAPSAKRGHGGGGGFRSMLATLIEALATARTAEATYRREIARGVHPATAVSRAFGGTCQAR